MNPLKQGLKPILEAGRQRRRSVFIHESIKTRVETYGSGTTVVNSILSLSMNPLKQGLKLLYSIMLSPDSGVSLSMNPLKQGLKPESTAAAAAVFIHESIKTRVETSLQTIVMPSYTEVFIHEFNNQGSESMKAIATFLVMAFLVSALGGISIELVSGKKVQGRFYQRIGDVSEIISEKDGPVQIRHEDVVRVWSEDMRDITQFFLSEEYGVKPNLPIVALTPSQNRPQVTLQTQTGQYDQQPPVVYLMNEQTATILAKPFMVMGVTMAASFGIGLVIALIAISK